MINIPKSKYVLSMNENNKPADYCKSGDMILFKCMDSYGEQVYMSNQKYESIDWNINNPATGPLFIESAEPGDLLKIEILEINIEDHGFMTLRPNAGALGHKWDEFSAKKIEIRDNVALFNDRFHIDVNPMIGVIGTAPKEDDFKCTVPNYHGGNMDCTEIKKGSILYLPVNVTGGLLSMGDIHAVMGDGEVSICGLEVSGDVIIRVDLIKGHEFPTPSVLNGDKFSLIYSAETLDEASLKVVDKMYTYIAEFEEIDKYELGSLLSLVGYLRINQIVDPLMTVRLEIPKDLISLYP